MLEIFKKLFGAGNKKAYDQELLNMFKYNTNDKSIVTPYSQHHVVYNAIRRISDGTRQISMKFTNDNGEYVDNNHIIYEIFKNSKDLIEGIAIHLELYGEAFLYFAESKGQQLNIRNIPSQPILLSPKFMTTNLNDDGNLISWTFNNSKTIDVEKLIQIKLYNPYSAHRGLSPLKALTLTMSSDYYAQKYNEAFFKNSAMPESLITIDKDAEIDSSIMKNLKQQLINKHQGVDKQHLPLVIQGADWKTLNLSQKEMDFLESRKFSRDEILAVFGVPPFVAGYTDSGDTNRATADTAYYLFMTNTIQPLLARVEENINKFFKQFNLNVYCKFSYENISVLKRDYSSKVADAAILLQNGFSRDEVNDKLELGFEDADTTRYLTMNLIPVDQINSEPTKAITTTDNTTTDIITTNTTNTTNTTTIDKSRSSNLRPTTASEVINKSSNAYRRNYLILQRNSEKRFKSTIKKYFFAQRKEVLKIINSSKEQKDYTEITSLLDEIRDEQDKKLIKEIKPVFEDIHEGSINMALNAIGSEEVVILDYTIINSKSNKLADVNEKTWKELRTTIYEGYNEGEAITKIADRVRAVYNNASTTRATTIARTESNSMMSETTFNTYKSEGVPKKQWLCAADPRPTHAAQRNMIINIEDTFPNGLKFPGDPTGSAAEIISCKCCISPIVE